MNKNNLLFIVPIAACCCISIICGCKKTSKGSIGIGAATIDYVSYIEGSGTDTILIRGTALNSDSPVSVLLNQAGQGLRLLPSVNGWLVATLPSGKFTTGQVSVSLAGHALTVPFDFDLSLKKLQISQGTDKLSISLTGSGLAANGLADTLILGGTHCTITYASADSLFATAAGNVPVDGRLTFANARQSITRRFAVINALTSAAGYAYTTDTLSGLNINPDTSRDQVTVNGAKATVIGATSTSLVFKVPYQTGDGTINLTVNGVTTVGPHFTYLHPALPTLTAIKPSTSDGADVFMLSGSGFSPQLNLDSLTYDGQPAGVQSESSGTSLTATFGPGPMYNTIVVGISVYGQKGSSSVNVNYLPQAQTAYTFAGQTGVNNFQTGDYYHATLSGPYLLAVDNHQNVLGFGGANFFKAVVNPFALSGLTVNNVNPSDLLVGMATDAKGNIFLADQTNNSVYLVPAGGNAQAIYTSSSKIVAISCDGSGNLFVARQLDVIKIKGSTASAFVGDSTTAGNSPGSGKTANFSNIVSLACDAQGNVYIADNANYSVYQVNPQGSSTLLAGGSNGYNNGQGNQAQFVDPGSGGIAVDNHGNVYVTETYNGGPGGNKIKVIDPQGNVTDFTGSGYPGFGNGPASGAYFSGIGALAVDANNNLYIADSGNQLIRLIYLGK